MISLICKICIKECKNYLGLVSHVFQKHSMRSKEYYDKFFKKDGEGVCSNPNCSNETSFQYLTSGYSKHCSYKCSNSDIVVKEKSKKTSRRKYGVDSHMKLEESRKKIREKRTGMKFSEGHKKNLSKSHEGKKIHSNEEKEKRRQYMLEGGAAYANSFIQNPSYPQIKTFENTKELFFGAILNYQFLNYSLDIAVPSIKLDIEHDGSYWHQDQEKDRKRDERIKSQGWKVLRYRDYVPSKEQLLEDVKLLLK